jgi:hypothetical protein
VDVYVEAGHKRTFAGAIEWPGWCRRGRDPDEALEALLGAAPRYASVVAGLRPAFRPPATVRGLPVVERLTGDATTDFGAPSITPEADRRPVDARELARLRAILEASWAALDATIERVGRRSLRTGPRGGGRTLPKIVAHVVEAESAYLRKLLVRAPEVPPSQARRLAPTIRALAVEGLERAVTQGLPEAGPRGGKLWTPRYFVRRAAWHVLDHAWEIEDRTV